MKKGETLSYEASNLREGNIHMLFVTLLVPKGKGAKAVQYLRELKAPKGIKIRDIYFTFGRYDGIIIYEAPSTSEAMDFTMKVGFETHYTMETLTAVQARES